MNFVDMTDAQLIDFRDKVQALHVGCSSKAIVIHEYIEPEIAHEYTEASAHPTISYYTPTCYYAHCSNDAIMVDGNDLSDLLWSLFIDAHNELCRRFSKELKKE